MPDETNKGVDKPKRTRRAGEFRYQVQVEAKNGGIAWQDSAASYKGPTEALEAGNKLVKADANITDEKPIIRACRVASPEFTVEAVTTTVLKKRTTK